ncbi:hypothetical protein IFR05_003665 [Cadophora sp. M221]|nr:hypothetical protein IFR05_003665 [Cadophora sp. M221]
MGQVCSGRRAKLTTSTRPPSEPAPPPYSAPKSPTTNTTEQEKEGPPELSSHPALRDRRNSSPSDSDSSNPIQKPPHAHLRGKSLQNEKENWKDIENITAGSTPQWRWSNTQCRAWLAEVLIVYGGRPSPVAHRLADGFRGWGPNLYMKEWKEWNSWLGADGQAIFALLMEEHAKEGAVPKEVEIEHYVLAEGGECRQTKLEIGLRSMYPLKSNAGNREKKTGREEIDNFVGKEAVESVRQQVASEWGKGRLRKLTEEREKLRAERENPVEGSEKENKTSRFNRRSKDASKA